MRLGPCKTSFIKPPVILYYLYIQGDTFAVAFIVLCFALNFCAVCTFVCCHIFGKVLVIEWSPIGKELLNQLLIWFLSINTYFSPPSQFLEWEFLSDCTISRSLPTILPFHSHRS